MGPLSLVFLLGVAISVVGAGYVIYLVYKAVFEKSTAQVAIPIPPVTAKTVVVLDGNSLMPGVAAPLQKLLGDGYEVRNVAIAGQTTLDMLINSKDVDVNLNSPNVVLVAWELRNDMLANDRMPVSAVDVLQTYCQDRKKAGFQKILVMNTIKSTKTGWGGAWNDITHEQVNAQLQKRWSNFADGLIDVAAVPALSDPSYLAYFLPDGTHLTSDGHAAAAAAIAKAIL